MKSQKVNVHRSIPVAITLIFFKLNNLWVIYLMFAIKKTSYHTTDVYTSEK